MIVGGGGQRWGIGTQRVIAEDDGEVTEADIARNGKWGRSASVTGPRFRDLVASCNNHIYVVDRQYPFEFLPIVSGLSPLESP